MSTNLAGLASAVDEVFGGNADRSSVKMWLSTGYPPLNEAISSRYDGGIPVGRITEIFGGESCGKTAIATQAMIEAQKAGGIAIYNDHERSFDEALAVDLGLDNTKGTWIYQKPKTFEASVTTTIRFCQKIREGKFIDDDAPIVVVFDSLAAMVPKSKFAKDVDEQGMNDSLALAKACSAVFPTLSVYAEELNIALIFLNQEREKPGVMFGDPTTTPGGRAPKFYASVRMQVGRTMIKGKEAGTYLGQTVKCNVVKNKVSRPFMKSTWRFMFRDDGTGYFDVVGSTIDHLVDIGVLKKSGAWIEWNGKKYNKQPLIDLIIKNGLQQTLFDLLPKNSASDPLSI